MVRRRHRTTIVRLHRHDGVGPDLTQLPLLLPPLPLSETQEDEGQFNFDEVTDVDLKSLTLSTLNKINENGKDSDLSQTVLFFSSLSFLPFIFCFLRNNYPTN